MTVLFNSLALAVSKKKMAIINGEAQGSGSLPPFCRVCKSDLPPIFEKGGLLNCKLKSSVSLQEPLWGLRFYRRSLGIAKQVYTNSTAGRILSQNSSSEQQLTLGGLGWD